MSATNRDEIPPPNVTNEERWIVHNKVESIRVEYRQTGADTAETYVHMKSLNGSSVVWKESTFNKFAQLCLTHNSCVEPAYSLRAKVKARDDWEKKQSADLELYRQLKERFE